MIPCSLIQLRKPMTLPVRLKKTNIPKIIYMTDRIAQQAYRIGGVYIKNDEWIPLTNSVNLGTNNYNIQFCKWIEIHNIKIL